MNSIKNRLTKVEKFLLPPPLSHVHLRIITDGQSMSDVESKQAIAEHLAKHPEDAGRDFSFINHVIIDPA